MATSSTETAKPAVKPAAKTAAPKAAAKPAAKAAPKAAKKAAAPKAKAGKSAKKTTAVEKAAAIKKAAKDATAKGRESATAAVHLTRDASFKLIDSQRAVWLAGLGALAKANTATGSKGEQAFEALVKAGATLEAQARGAIDTNAERLKSGIDGATDVLDQGIDRVSSAFDSLVEQALDRLGFPKGDAFKELFDRLSELSKSLETKVRSKLGS